MVSFQYRNRAAIFYRLHGSLSLVDSLCLQIELHGFLEAEVDLMHVAHVPDKALR